MTDGRRGQGVGSIFLNQLRSCLADAECVLGEAEDPDRATDEEARALRERRLQFYLRCGCLKTGLTSVVFGEDYRILEAPLTAPHTTEELRTIYTELYQNIFPSRFFRTQFKVSQEESKTDRCKCSSPFFCKSSPYVSFLAV